MKHPRINLILFLTFLFAAAILGRLVFIQIINHDLYAALARGQQKFFAKMQGDRGEIFLKNHDIPLATNQTYTLVYISPEEIPIEERETTAQILSETLNLNQVALLGKIERDSLYELIKEKISEEELTNLKEQELTGVYFAEEKLRYYPYDDLAAHLLGFVNKDGFGQYGLEEYWDDALQGREEFWEGERGPWGYLFSSGGDLADSQGADLILSIDYNIQYLAEKLLKQVQENLNIEGGQIIVMEPSSGKILTLANFPSFNPNEYSQEKDFKVFQNGTIQKIFEPGSVFKPITMASALNEEKITPQTTYRDPGMVEIDGWPIYNYEERIHPGDITMTEILEKSINTGAVFVERQIGHQKFLDYIERFGIFEKTNIDLKGEIFSQNTELKKGYEINFATASFGQGIEMTPMQLARAFCAIANGGKLVEPYLVEKIKKNDNEIIETQPQISDNFISSKTASKLTAMLVSVVENGFAKAARIPGYYVAGKTGTAQISFAALGLDKKGYSDKTWQSFIGFAPAFDPQFLILIKLNNPETKTAEYSAVPLFQELAKYIIDYYQIPPDHE